MSGERRPGIGEWPVWGQEPPRLWIGQAQPLPVPATGPPPLPLPPPAPAAPAHRGPRLPGFLLGLLGACLCWIPVLGLGSALVGAVLSMQARRLVPAGQRGRELPMVGLVLGCVGVVGGVLWSAIFATIALDRLLSTLAGG